MGVIEAVAKLWPICLVFLIGVIVVIFRKEIKEILPYVKKFRIKGIGGMVEVEKEGVVEAEGGLEAEGIVSPEEAGIAGEAEEGSKESRILKTADEWTSEMIDALVNKDTKRGKEAYDKAQEAEENAVKRLQNRAFYLWLLFDIGDTRALSDLRDMADDSSMDRVAMHDVKRYLGYCYRRGNSFDLALREHEDALELSEGEEQRAGDTIEIARCMFNLGEKDESVRRIMAELEKAEDSRAISELYIGLAGIYELANDEELRALALEKALELIPNNVSMHFRVGYLYGQKGLNRLSLLHYKTLLRFNDEHTYALNNIGATYGELGMPIKAVSNYKKSAAGRETLASSNLAFKYLEAGFKDDASDVLNEARKQDNIHGNVGKALARLEEAVEQEDEEEKKILEEAREQQQFLIGFAEAYFKQKVDCPRFDGVWKNDDNEEMKVSQTGSNIEAEWPIGERKYKITGIVSNRGVKARVSEWKYILGKGGHGFEEVAAAYAMVHEDGNELEIMQIRDGRHKIIDFHK